MKKAWKRDKIYKTLMKREKKFPKNKSSNFRKKTIFNEWNSMKNWKNKKYGNKHELNALKTIYNSITNNILKFKFY